MRIGGTLPLLAVLAERGITSIVSGFALPDDAFHAPNESYRLESLRLGEAAARELYVALAELPRSCAKRSRQGPAAASACRNAVRAARAGCARCVVVRTCQRPAAARCEELLRRVAARVRDQHAALPVHQPRQQLQQQLHVARLVEHVGRDHVAPRRALDDRVGRRPGHLRRLDARPR